MNKTVKFKYKLSYRDGSGVITNLNLLDLKNSTDKDKELNNDYTVRHFLLQVIGDGYHTMLKIDENDWLIYSSFHTFLWTKAN